MNVEPINMLSPRETNNTITAFSEELRRQAERIAEIYLNTHPRKLLYGVTLTSSEDDSEQVFYHPFSAEELDILKACSNKAKEEECSLEEILSSEGHDELVEKLVENNSPFPLNIVESIDLDNPLKFTNFSVQQVKDDETLGYKRNIGVALTDEEYRQLLADMLLNSNRFSMNMLVYKRPEMARKIMDHLVWASWDFVEENYTPFIADMSEVREACRDILDPFKDVLGLFSSEDKEIRGFVLRHQIVPDCGELYGSYTEDDWFHVLMDFSGTTVSFDQEGISHITNRHYGEESFKVEAQDVMKKFSLNKPEEIYPYLKEHFNTRTCLSELKELFS